MEQETGLRLLLNINPFGLQLNYDNPDSLVCEPRRNNNQRLGCGAVGHLSPAISSLISHLSLFTTLIFRPRPADCDSRPGLTGWLRVAFSGWEYLRLTILIWLTDWLQCRPPSPANNKLDCCCWLRLYPAVLCGCPWLYGLENRFGFSCSRGNIITYYRLQTNYNRLVRHWETRT